MNGFRSRTIIAACTVLVAALVARPSSASVGFQVMTIPQPNGPPTEAAFWYPSLAVARSMRLGFADQNVAVNGAVAGNNLPLVVISHGALGSIAGHSDTAIALAQSGYVVAAVNHHDAGVFRLGLRPSQLAGLITYATRTWPFHEHIDQARIGAFGFSLGGFAVLVAIGGTPDPALIAPHCGAAPEEWSCSMVRAGYLDTIGSFLPKDKWAHDYRIKAAAVAAPALGYLFNKEGLQAVKVPVELWQAERDHVLDGRWSAEPVTRGLPSPPELHVVAGADHPDFTAPCAADLIAKAPARCGDKTGFDRAAFHERFNSAVVQFFDAKLRSGTR